MLTVITTPEPEPVESCSSPLSKLSEESEVGSVDDSEANDPRCRSNYQSLAVLFVKNLYIVEFINLYVTRLCFCL